MGSRWLPPLPGLCRALAVAGLSTQDMSATILPASNLNAP